MPRDNIRKDYLPMTKAAFFGDQSQLDYVYAQGRAQRVAELTNLHPHTVTNDNFDEHAPQLGELEVIFSTWGFPALTPAQLDKLPSLKAVFYGAGSVQGFARPFLERGIVVMSAWHAIGLSVAEFTLAQILLSTKGYFRNVQGSSTPEGREAGPFRGRGNFGKSVALLGAGAVGRRLIELLKPFKLKVLVFDPFLSEEAAAALGVEKVSIEDAFSRALVVSNHLANNPGTRGLIYNELWGTMRQDATFINTGRGSVLVESELIAALQARPDLTALLDVTDPEPPAPDSLFYTLPNLHLTSHIAGSIGDEVVCMADFCIDEFLAWQDGRPLKYQVTEKMLETMA